MTKLKDCYYTGLWASGYVWSTKKELSGHLSSSGSAYSEPRALPVSIYDIELLCNAITGNFMISCNRYSVEEEPEKFKNLQPFTLEGPYQIVERDPLGCVKSMRLCIDSTWYTMEKGLCVSLPIPNGEAYFCFTSRLNQPRQNLTPPFFGRTDEQKYELLQSSEEEIIQSCVHTNSDEDLGTFPDEFDFDALFD